MKKNKVNRLLFVMAVLMVSILFSRQYVIAETPFMTPDEEIAAAAEAFSWDDIKEGNDFENNVTGNLVNPLPVTGLYDTTISWSTTPDNGWIDTTTGAVTIPTPLQGDMEVMLEASFMKNGASYPASRIFRLTIKAPSLFDGSGTANDPYLIKTVEDLVNINNTLTVSQTIRKYFRLENNIDLNTAPYNTGEGWMPITGFKGVFEGNGKVISGLFINRPAETGVGLFKGVEGGIIRDLGVTGVNITGHSNAGGLAGSIFSKATVERCFTTGSISGDNEEGDGIGGLIGYNDSGTISESYSEADMAGQFSVGGLVGRNQGNINNSYALGNISGYSYIGGLVGFDIGGASYFISNCYAAGTVSGDDNIGGLVGNAQFYEAGADSFWDINTSGVGDSEGGVGKTTEQMKQFDTFCDIMGGTSLWDFGSVWKIGNNISYPTFQWASNWTVDEEIAAAKYELDFDDFLGENTDPSITTDLVLSASGARGTNISWATDRGDLINVTTGAITRPDNTQGDQTAMLTAMISKSGGTSLTDEFFVTIVATLPDDEITMDINALAWDSIKGSNDVPGNIIMDLINPLPTAGTHGTTITWSETSGRINTITGVVTRPSFTQGDQTVTLTATVSKSGGTSQIKNFVLTIKANDSISPDECFIATAAFGSKFDWPVALLREFRDQYLLTNSLGTAFVNFYYKHSPPIAVFIADSQPLKVLVRVLLVPVISIVYIIYHPIIMITILGLLILFLVYLKLQRRYFRV